MGNGSVGKKKKKKKSGSEFRIEVDKFFVFAFLLTFFFHQKLQKQTNGALLILPAPHSKKMSSWILPIPKVDPLIPTKDTSTTQGHMRYGKRHRLEIQNNKNSGRERNHTKKSH